MRRRTVGLFGAPAHRGRLYLAAIIVLVAAFTILGTLRFAGQQPVTANPTLAQLTSPTVNSLPSTRLEVLVDDVQAPTSLAVAADGTILVTAGGDLSVLGEDGRLDRTGLSLPDMVDDGLVALALANDFQTSRRAFVCYRTDTEMRVTALELSTQFDRTYVEPALVTGIPLQLEGGQGCQLEVGPDGNLYIATSDGGDPRAPQDLAALGGKILRIDPDTRQAPADNPFADHSHTLSRLVYSYGHRDVAGLAWDSAGQLYAVDRGPDREDEINLIVAGGNYGWDPASASTTSYQTDGVPMTDLGIAHARPAAWNSGSTAPGLGPAVFVAGEQWGMLAGDLAVANTGGPRVLFMQVTGEIVGEPIMLTNTNVVGQSIALAQGPDGALYAFGTSNGVDRLVRLSVID